MSDLTASELFIKYVPQFDAKGKIIKNRIESIYMNDNLKTKLAIDNLLKLLSKLKEIYGDGFQVKDLFSTIGLTPLLLEFINNYKETEKEKTVITPEQKLELIKQFTNGGLPIFWTDNGIDNRELGIEALNELVLNLTNVAINALKAAKDGIDITDVQYLPTVGISLYHIIECSPKAWAEAKNLCAAECNDILMQIFNNLFSIIK